MQQAKESEDYVMVEFDIQDVAGKNDLSDDDSYDYCDDLYSVHSNSGQTHATASEADNSVLSVPSGLLKDLDEAHAAAKLAIPQDAEDVTTVQSSQSVTISATEQNDKELQTSVTEKEEKMTPKASVPIKSAPLSRVSNKKRRKQTKLLKKAKAAAQASKALSEKAARMASSSSAGSTTKPLPKLKKTAKKGRSKRVHPHVACAHDEIAAYHNEVRMMSHQKVQ